MAPDADDASIRLAYRARARRHHPDRARDDGAEMAAINEAYRVLRDPARRVDYDRRLRADATGAASRPDDARPATKPTMSGSYHATRGTSHRGPGGTIYDDEPLQRARVPWRMLTVIGGLAVGVVLASSLLYEPPTPREPDGVLRPGSCVQIEPNGDAREIRCTGEADLVVERLVQEGEPCPTRTRPHRDRQGLGIACIRLDA